MDGQKQQPPTSLVSLLCTFRPVLWMPCICWRFARIWTPIPVSRKGITVSITMGITPTDWDIGATTISTIPWDPCMVYLSLFIYIWVIYGANVGIHIPAPWILWLWIFFGHNYRFFSGFITTTVELHPTKCFSTDPVCWRIHRRKAQLGEVYIYIIIYIYNGIYIYI